MSDQDDLRKLASDFVDLWREHLAQQASDPALAQWAEVWLKGLGRGMAGETGSAPAGVSSDEFGHRLDEFAARLARCEQRLDVLEAKFRKP
ncbi:MAG: hypothetical protein GDA49_12285 [Rhodospirillales bacterium]|nr:hypothetical protein [Rhodospirillales bacterium]